MTDPTADFFAELERRGHEPHLEKATGTVGIHLERGGEAEHWHVAIRKGDVTVSREDTDADCVVRAGRDLFDALVEGRTNAMAAILRGEIGVEGDLELVVLFQRLLPGPPGSRNKRGTGGYARRQS